MHNPQSAPCETTIPDIGIDSEPHDPIPAVLQRLRHIDSDDELCQRTLELLDEHLFLHEGEDREQ